MGKSGLKKGRSRESGSANIMLGTFFLVWGFISFESSEDRHALRHSLKLYLKDVCV